MSTKTTTTDTTDTDATVTDANAWTGGSFGPVVCDDVSICGYCGCPAEGPQCPCCGEAP